jgi:hypothetical protein
MQEREVRDLLKRMLTDLDPAFGYEVHHQEFTADMPQSGERLNRDNLRAMHENYPNPPTFQLRRVLGAGDVWVVEAPRRLQGQALPHGHDRRVSRQQDLEGDPLLRRAVPAARLEGSVGRADRPAPDGVKHHQLFSRLLRRSAFQVCPPPLPLVSP